MGQAFQDKPKRQVCSNPSYLSVRKQGVDEHGVAVSHSCVPDKSIFTLLLTFLPFLIVANAKLDFQEFGIHYL